MPESEIPVLIVGGGAAGLTSSLLLSDLGVESLLVEQHPGTSLLPKAHILNPRTMEIFDHLGIAEEVYAAGAPHERNSMVRYMSSLGGDEPWDRWEFWSDSAWSGADLSDFYESISAFHHGNTPQKILEPILRRVAEERNPGNVRFSHQLTSFEQDDDGVTAVILDRESGQTSTVRARYAIAADGGRTLGPALGAQMQGMQAFIDVVSVHFRADLRPYLEHDDNCITLIDRPGMDGQWISSALISMGPEQWSRDADEWHIGVAIPIPEEHDRDSYDEQRALADVRRVLNIADLDAEILHISHWLLEGVVADRYQVGRVFMVGDSAHRHSPFGGLGLNTAVQDVHNLCWKLAAAVKGDAAPALLETYGPERRPVGQRNVEFATFNVFNHVQSTIGWGVTPGMPEEMLRSALEQLCADTLDGAMRRARMKEIYDTTRLEWQAADIELGYEYSDGGGVVPDGTDAPPRDPLGHVYRQAARPGHRLPHAWLDRDGEQVHTHGLIRPGRFLLVAGEAGQDWVAAAAEQSVEIDAYRVAPDGDLHDLDGSWSQLRGHDAGGAVLVRPDGHVAFRALTASPDAAKSLSSALEATLGHVTAGVEAGR